MTIHVGHCLDVLSALPSDSIDCCVTSPPYYGLRKYDGVDPVVWGGDAGCAHEWGDSVRVHKGGPPGAKGALRGGTRAVADAQCAVKLSPAFWRAVRRAVLCSIRSWARERRRW